MKKDVNTLPTIDAAIRNMIQRAAERGYGYEMEFITRNTDPEDANTRLLDGRPAFVYLKVCIVAPEPSER